MIVKVIGKYLKNGVGKTSGKPYTCVNAFVSKKLTVPGGVGEAAEMVSLHNTDIQSVKLGAEYELEYNRRGFVDTFTPVVK